MTAKLDKHKQHTQIGQYPDTILYSHNAYKVIKPIKQIKIRTHILFLLQKNNYAIYPSDS